MKQLIALTLLLALFACEEESNNTQVFNENILGDWVYYNEESGKVNTDTFSLYANGDARWYGAAGLGIITENGEIYPELINQDSYWVFEPKIDYIFSGGNYLYIELNAKVDLDTNYFKTPDGNNEFLEDKVYEGYIQELSKSTLILADSSLTKDITIPDDGSNNNIDTIVNYYRFKKVK